MPTVEYMGKVFEVNEDGFLTSFGDWCNEWVMFVKESEGIEELGDEHWGVISFLQDYYRRNGIAPMVRVLAKMTKLKLKVVYELFPSGPGEGACKMAGLPGPTGCV